MMTHKALTTHEWEPLHKRLDTVVAEAARVYLMKLTTRRIHINVQRLSDELEELRLGREPDYDMPGLPLAYALRYMPRRVVSVLGSLLSVLGRWQPRSVLDVGSGTGATAVALDLLNLSSHVNLLGIEPSPEMILFSECSRCRDRVSATYRQSSLADLAKDTTPLELFDLLVFSACFPYGFDDWSPVLAALGDYQGQESKMMLVVEPDVKGDLLATFQRRLRSRGWPTKTFWSRDFPDSIKDNDLPLPEMEDVWRRVGLDESCMPRTWWNPPDDKFLVVNPEPLRPVKAVSCFRFASAV